MKIIFKYFTYSYWFPKKYLLFRKWITKEEAKKFFPDKFENQSEFMNEELDMCLFKHQYQKWININHIQPPINQSILVAAKEDNYYAEVHGPKDNRCINIYVGYFYDQNESFKKLKKKDIKFVVECGCSGSEYDSANLEVLFWMPLPPLP